MTLSRRLPAGYLLLVSSSAAYSESVGRINRNALFEDVKLEKGIYNALGTAETTVRWPLFSGSNIIRSQRTGSQENVVQSDSSGANVIILNDESLGSNVQAEIFLGSTVDAVTCTSNGPAKQTCKITAINTGTCFVQRASKHESRSSGPLRPSEAVEVLSGDVVRFCNVEARVFFPANLKQEVCSTYPAIAVPDNMPQPRPRRPVSPLCMDRVDRMDRMDCMDRVDRSSRSSISAGPSAAVPAHVPGRSLHHAFASLRPTNPSHKLSVCTAVPAGACKQDRAAAAAAAEAEAAAYAQAQQSRQSAPVLRSSSSGMPPDWSGLPWADRNSCPVVQSHLVLTPQPSSALFSSQFPTIAEEEQYFFSLHDSQALDSMDPGTSRSRAQAQAQAQAAMCSVAPGERFHAQVIDASGNVVPPALYGGLEGSSLDIVPPPRQEPGQLGVPLWKCRPVGSSRTDVDDTAFWFGLVGGRDSGDSGPRGLDGVSQANLRHVRDSPAVVFTWVSTRRGCQGMDPLAAKAKALRRPCGSAYTIPLGCAPRSLHHAHVVSSIRHLRTAN